MGKHYEVYPIGRRSPIIIDADECRWDEDCVEPQTISFYKDGKWVFTFLANNIAGYAEVED